MLHVDEQPVVASRFHHFADLDYSGHSQADPDGKLACFEFLFCSVDERSSADLVALLRESLKMSTDVLREIAFLHGAIGVHLPSTIPEMRVFRAYLPELRQTRIINYYAGLGRDVSQFERSIAELSPLKAGNAPLVDGNTLSEVTGLEPGPRMGRLKGLLHRIQVERLYLKHI